MILYVNGLNSRYRMEQQPSYKEKAWETHGYRKMHRTRTVPFCFQLTEFCWCLKTASWRRIGECRKLHFINKNYKRKHQTRSERCGQKKIPSPTSVYIFKTIYERQLHEDKVIFSMDSRGLPLQFYLPMYSVISCIPLCRKSNRS